MSVNGLTELAAAVLEVASSGKPQLNSKTYVEDDARMGLIMQFHDQATQTPEYKQLERVAHEASERAKDYWKAVDAEAMRMFKEHGAELFSDLDEAQQQRTANSVYRRRAQDALGPAPTGAAQASQAIDAFVRAYLDAHMPERNPHADSARQRRDQQALEAFKRWHEGSKAVDREGNPIIAFHATSKVYDVFTCGDEAALRKSSSNPDYSGALGAWFAAPSLYDTNYDEGAAESTAEGFVEDHRGIREYRDGANVMPVYLAIKYPKEFGDYEDFQDERDSYESQWDFKQAMLAAGHDGFVIRNCDTDGFNDRDDWVAFYPHQIKSAIGNSGVFDPSSPSLTDAAPAPEKAATPLVKLTQLETFKRWHGKSKLVLPSGEPMRAFHGTNKDLDVFEPGGKAQAIFITVDPGYASVVAETKGWGNGDNVIPVYVRAENPMFVSESEYSFDAIAQAKQGGFDALITTADDGSFGRTIAVFSPHQLKSAIGNSGAFDPDSASLTDATPAAEKVASRQLRTALQSDAFRAWFGDSKVSENGTPLVAYHGTYGGFEGDSFSYDVKGINSYGDADIGFFFGSSEVANAFTDHDAEGSCVIPVYLSIKNPKVVQGANFVAMLDSLDTDGWHSFKSKAIKAGYDGVIVRTDDEARNSEYSHQFLSDNYIAFYPHQIKSAIGNSGAFDPESPSLTDRNEVPELEPEGCSMEPF